MADCDVSVSVLFHIPSDTAGAHADISTHDKVIHRCLQLSCSPLQRIQSLHIVRIHH
jgi:hypothetical protein